MKKRLLAVILLTVMILTQLTSCLYLPFGSLDGSLSGEGGFWDVLKSWVDGDTTVVGGDTNNIYIEGSTNTDAVAASRALLSSVSVYCNFNVYSGGALGKTASAGSGVIYKLDKEQGDAYIITNFHVVYNSKAQGGTSDEISIFLYGLENAAYAIPATYVGGCMQADIAVLRVEDSRVLAESLATAVTVANSDEVAVLDTAIAVGNAEALGLSATVGSVNVDSEEITLAPDGVNAVKIRVMRIDTAVNEGNSGGGVFNSVGELIGIVNAKSSDTSIEGIGYAIPSNLASAVADNIIFYCNGTTRTSAYRCLLGVTVGVAKMYTELDPDTAIVKKRETVVVTKINEGSVIEGVLAVDDEIVSVSVDGVEYDVVRLYSIGEAMLHARVGSTVSFKIVRAGEETSVSFVVPERALSEYK